MKETATSGMLQTTIEKVKEMIDVSTIIGDPVYTESGSATAQKEGFGSPLPSKSNG